MIEKKEFGRTGHNSTRTLFGAAALSNVTPDEAERTMEILLDYGINHIDTAASYGQSEKRLGPLLQGQRDKFFLATKTEKRTHQEAWTELRTSLRRLGVDYVDLWQMHFLIDPEEWEVAMGPGGALEAFIEAREQGLARFLGVTGHDWHVVQMHMKSLERFDFDSVLLPYTYPMMQNTAYASDFKALMELCAERNVAVQTIKSITRRPWEDQEKTAATWYEPLVRQADIDLAVHWVLANEQVFLNTVGDIYILPKVLEAASRFEVGPSDEQMQKLLQDREMKPLF
jgi:aryl-alcohol dehydrogenase-like predicted oxidoreductase